MTAAQIKRKPVALPLERVAFENTFVRDLPADPVLANTPRQVAAASYTRVEPTPVRAPRLLGWSEDLSEMLGIALPADASGIVAEVLGGNRVSTVSTMIYQKFTFSANWPIGATLVFVLLAMNITVIALHSRVFREDRAHA